jgi:hypothetical protein
VRWRWGGQSAAPTTGQTSATTAAAGAANRSQGCPAASLPGQGVDKDVAPGQTITVQVNVGGKALPFFCKYHRTSGMVGSLLPKG